MGDMLAGRVALVSGIGPGLGIEIARLYAQEGADIVMGARRTEVMEPLAAEIEAMGRRTVWQSTDITDPAQCQALADAAVEKLGRLDVCVNNAFNDGFPVINVVLRLRPVAAHHWGLPGRERRALDRRRMTAEPVPSVR